MSFNGSVSSPLVAGSATTNIITDEISRHSRQS
jgi:hypothetical protein